MRIGSANVVWDGGEEEEERERKKLKALAHLFLIKKPNKEQALLF